MSDSGPGTLDEIIAIKPMTLESARRRGLIARNFLSLSAAALAERFIGLFSSVYARRVLEAVAIGQVSWTGSVLSYFGLLVNPGLQTIAKREVARAPRRAARHVSLLFLLQVILALIGFALVSLFGSVAMRGPEIRLLLTLQAISLILLPLDLTWLLHAHERMAPLAGASVAVHLLQTIALFLFIHEPAHVMRYVLLPYPFRLALNGFTIWYATRHHLLDWRGVNLSLSGARSLLQAAIPLGLSQVAILLYYNSDAIFLGFTHGDAAVGLYSTAYSMMLVPTFLGGALLNAYFPSLARSFTQPEQARQVSEEFLRLMVWLGFPIATLGWAVGRHVVVLLFGTGFAESGPLFEWLCLNLALIFFNVGYNQPLNAWQHQSLVFRCTLAGAIANVGVNFWLIPKYGPEGAIVTTILAELVVLVAAVLARRNLHPLPWYGPILRTGTISLVAGLIARTAILSSAPWWGAAFLGLFVCLGGFMFLERAWTCKALAHLKRYQGGFKNDIS